MKNFILLCSAILGSIVVNGQAVTVLHHVGNATTFYGNTGLLQAYSASVNGDTIYLPGGFYTPPALFDKRVTIIGAGHNPDSSGVTRTTTIIADINLGENSDGCFFSGFVLNGSFVCGNNISANNISIIRVKIDVGISMPGNRSNPCINGFIKECIITGDIGGTNISQFTFTNCVIGYRFYDLETSLISNNIFLGGDNLGAYRVFYDVNQCVIRNNIFYKGLMDFPTSTSNQFQHNLFTNTPSLGNNTFTGSYFNVSVADIFVNYANNGFTYTNNFHLKTPAVFAGNDATQVGLYGSAKPWKEGSMPLNPHIQTKTIAENTNADGKIQVQLKVTAQNN